MDDNRTIDEMFDDLFPSNKEPLEESIESIVEASMEAANKLSKIKPNRTSESSKKAPKGSSRVYDGLVWIDTWEELEEAFANTYKYSFRDICSILKCERTWVNQYIKPWVPYIYLGSGFSSAPASGSMEYEEGVYRDSDKDFVKHLLRSYKKQSEHHDYSELINRLSGHRDAVWFNSESFDELFKRHISVSRSTINVPVELLIKPSLMDSFREHYRKILEEEPIDFRGINPKALKSNSKDFLAGWGESALSVLPNVSKRNSMEYVQTDMPKFTYRHLYSIHDKMDYGDTVERHYRFLFKTGAYKLELRIPDRNNPGDSDKGFKTSSKVFYLIPEDGASMDQRYHIQYVGIGADEFPIKNSLGYILLSYQLYDSFIKPHLSEYEGLC